MFAVIVPKNSASVLLMRAKLLAHPNDRLYGLKIASTRTFHEVKPPKTQSFKELLDSNLWITAEKTIGEAVATKMLDYTKSTYPFIIGVMLTTITFVSGAGFMLEKKLEKKLDKLEDKFDKRMEKLEVAVDKLEVAVHAVLTHLKLKGG